MKSIILQLGKYGLQRYYILVNRPHHNLDIQFDILNQDIMCYLRFTPKGLQYLTLDEALDVVEKDDIPENRLAILFGYDVIVPVCPFVDTWECGEWEETLIVHFGTVSTPF